MRSRAISVIPEIYKIIQRTELIVKFHGKYNEWPSRWTVTWDTRPIQASLSGREGKGGLSMHLGTPCPTLVDRISQSL